MTPNVSYKTNTYVWEDIVEYREDVPGMLVWKNTVLDILGRPCKIRAGKAVGGITEAGYYRFSYQRYKNYKHHRVIWEMFHRKLSSTEMIDHIDGDTTNNKIGNLRLANYDINGKNQSLRVTNTSGVIGVSRQYKDKEKTEKRCYWVAHWRDLDKKIKQKWFSVVAYGEQLAFELACKIRKEAIDNLLASGDVYTTRHGT